MARSNPALLLAGLVGLAAAAVVGLVMAASSSAELFVTQGKARFWRKELADKLRKRLSELKATPHSQVERVWVLGPTGPQSALELVKGIQAKGEVATSTPNLLDSGATALGIGEVTAEQLMTFADPSAAILPVL